MSLITLFKSNPDSFDNYLARQILAFAGKGEIRDNSDCSVQLRQYFRLVQSERLAAYASECLSQAFPDSGLFLQDVVNELGRRLEFEVENGRYRGTSNAVGFDGLWRMPGGSTILVEVKTTDTYNVSLDAVAGYQRKLVDAGTISPDSSILFVVGRKDTGSLEAQIRGSRFAWDMRVVGVESLTKLVRVKEKSSEDKTIELIRELLRPFEYTRVDRILDVVFDATTDISQDSEDSANLDVEESTQSEILDSNSPQNRTPQNAIESIRIKAAESLSKAENCNLVRKRQALFEDITSDVRACITISKRYADKLQPYWYAFHPKWGEFLESATSGFMVFGCVDRQEAYAVPIKEMESFLPSLNQTVRPDGAMYWHVKLAEGDAGLIMFASKTGERFDLSPYRLTF